MTGLAQQMAQLKISGQGASAAYSALQAEYDQISATLGGDDPARTLADGQPAVDGRGGSAPEGGAIGIVPTPPAGCLATSTTTSGAPALAIPTGPAVVSTTLNVAGADPFLWDLNLRTFITHTFPGDLDMTLQSPAGTVVTISSDNAGTNDDAFNGTIWDDSANPSGQVPYTNNNGLVTDHLYAISTSPAHWRRRRRSAFR
jgi:hypothetical protein